MPGPYTNIVLPVSGQPVSKAQFGEPVKLAIDDLHTRTNLLEVGASQSYYNASSQAPLSSTAGVDGEIVSGLFEFVAGYAYRVDWFFRFTLTGTGTNCRGAICRFHRANSTGTLLHSSGYVDADTFGIDKMHQGSFLLKCTGVNKTQTISMCAQFSGVATGGTITAVNTASGATSPSRFTIERIGVADNHTGAMEVPTS